MAYVLRGDLLTMDPARPEVADGALYVGDDGYIEAVAGARELAPPGFDAAPRIATRGLVAPGLIDLHNHVAYNHRPLWRPPRAIPYTSRSQWSGEDAYRREVREPTVLLCAVAPLEVFKYGEVKALVAGSTAIQGSAKWRRPPPGWLVRNIEWEQFGTGGKLVWQSVQRLAASELAPTSALLRGGKPFVYHLAEGTSASLLSEFHDLERGDCLHPPLVAIHATALGATEFASWRRAGAGSVVWSPLSNLWLYGETTDVPAVHDAGLRLCLGADWAPSGSKNVLGELKVADLLNRTRYDGRFSAAELCAMVTANPADALGWSDRVGRLRTGLRADILVTARRGTDLHRRLVETTARDIRLVAIDGRPLYGTPGLMAAAGVVGDEPITVAGLRRRICLGQPEGPGPPLWPGIVATLRSAGSAPADALEAAANRVLEEGEEPFELIPDIPGDEPSEEIGVAAMTVPERMPPLDSLVHDRAYFAAIAAAAIPAGGLDRLAAYYAGGPG